jgi:3-deoxy-manno-octulosonate cytidylyltransferase (CMP-KDO synthetase)
MTNTRKVIGVIPARLDSTRLPRKVLRVIAGKAMVQWVYENARKSPLLDELLVATDSEEVRQYCRHQGMAVMMTGIHSSGSDRLHEVMNRTDGSIYVNIQGDEPTLRPEHLESLLPPLLVDDAEITTLKVAIDEAAARNPNQVKVITDVRGQALYFSRFPIPCDRDGKGGIRYFKHIGIYAYSRGALNLFHSLPQSSLELAEKLEQLRYLENGIPILVVETPFDTVGVDTEDDLDRVISWFAEKGTQVHHPAADPEENA